MLNHLLLLGHRFFLVTILDMAIIQFINIVADMNSMTF